MQSEIVQTILLTLFKRNMSGHFRPLKASCCCCTRLSHLARNSTTSVRNRSPSMSSSMKRKSQFSVCLSRVPRYRGKRDALSSQKCQRMTCSGTQTNRLLNLLSSHRCYPPIRRVLKKQRWMNMQLRCWRQIRKKLVDKRTKKLVLVAGAETAL